MTSARRAPRPRGLRHAYYRDPYDRGHHRIRSDDPEAGRRPHAQSRHIQRDGEARIEQAVWWGDTNRRSTAIKVWGRVVQGAKRGLVTQSMEPARFDRLMVAAFGADKACERTRWGLRALYARLGLIQLHRQGGPRSKILGVEIVRFEASCDPLGLHPGKRARRCELDATRRRVERAIKRGGPARGRQGQRPVAPGPTPAPGPAPAPSFGPPVGRLVRTLPEKKAVITAQTAAFEAPERGVRANLNAVEEKTPRGTQGPTDACGGAKAQQPGSRPPKPKPGDHPAGSLAWAMATLAWACRDNTSSEDNRKLVEDAVGPLVYGRLRQAGGGSVLRYVGGGPHVEVAARIAKLQATLAASWAQGHPERAGEVEALRQDDEGHDKPLWRRYRDRPRNPAGEARVRDAMREAFPAIGIYPCEILGKADLTREQYASCFAAIARARFHEQGKAGWCVATNMETRWLGRPPTVGWTRGRQVA